MAEDRKHYPNSGIVFEADDEKREKFKGLDGEGDGSVECPHCKKTVTFYISEYLKQGARGMFRTLRFKIKTKQPQPTGSLNDFPSNKQGQTSMPLSGGGRKMGDDIDDSIPF